MSDACRFERDVMTGPVTDALRAHIAECADCSAAAAVSPWMQRFAALDDREHILPNPAVLYLKAQLLRGNAEAARVSRPITIAQLVSYAVVAACWAALLTWKWDAIQAALRALTPSGLVANAASNSLSLSLFPLVLLLGSATVMLALHTIIAEE